jgi:hypothetical protein
MNLSSIQINLIPKSKIKISTKVIIRKKPKEKLVNNMKIMIKFLSNIKEKRKNLKKSSHNNK